MNRINLTETDLAVMENAMIEFGAVVTFDQLVSLCNEDRKYANKRINKLTKQGWLKRIKKGVFALSDLSSRGMLAISHKAVVNHLVDEAYISFEAALQHHGLYNQLLSSINSIALKQYQTTVIDGMSYNFIKTQPEYFYGWDTYTIDGQSVKIASVEKALIDLVQFHRSRYSTDLVLEKLTDDSDNIEYQKLVEYILKANLTTRRIMGFLMDCAAMETSMIYLSTAKKTSTSSISSSEHNRYNSKWRIFYDRHFSQYTQEQIDPAAAGIDQP
jgi:predicted transcriptional regulator of viral defense system